MRGFPLEEASLEEKKNIYTKILVNLGLSLCDLSGDTINDFINFINFINSFTRVSLTQDLKR